MNQLTNEQINRLMSRMAKFEYLTLDQHAEWIYTQFRIRLTGDDILLWLLQKIGF